MTTLEERAPGYFMTPTEREALTELLAKAERLAGELADAYRQAQRIITGTSPLVADTRPSYWPERMGYLNELRHGDRALFAGGWREVDRWFEDFDGRVSVWFTDPDMDVLTDRGTYAIRIQKMADEQELDALHRRDTGGL